MTHPLHAAALLTLFSSSAFTAPLTTEPICTSSLLDAVPDSAIAMLYCPDYVGFHERASRNAWANLLGSPEGGFLLADLQPMWGPGAPSLKQLATVSAAIGTETLIFATENGGAFLTKPPASTAELLAMLRALAPDLATEGRVVEAAGGTLTLPPQRTEPGLTIALIDHPNALGLIAAESERALMELTQQTISRLGQETRSSLAHGFETARSKVGATGGLELFIDFSHLARAAQVEISKAASSIMPDPVKLLGLEEGVWFYLTLDLQPGVHVESRGHLAIPSKTGLATLADTFKPQPPTLPGMIPIESWQYSALEWDVVAFSNAVRAMLLEDVQAEVSQGVAAAGAIVGMDAEKEVFQQLTGSFLFHDTLDPKAWDPLTDALGVSSGLGISFGVRDGEAFAESLENLMSATMTEEFINIEESNGRDVYLFEDDSTNGGFCITDNRVLIALGRAALDQQIAVQSGETEKSLLKGTPIGGIIDENQGCCFSSVFELGQLLDQALQFSRHGDRTNEKLIESLSFARGVHFVATGRRVSDGFDFRHGTR